jgi:hypothetical protein
MKKAFLLMTLGLMGSGIACDQTYTLAGGSFTPSPPTGCGQWGYTSQNGDMPVTSTLNTQAYFFPVQATSSGNATSLAMYVNCPCSGGMVLGLYSDSGPNPGPNYPASLLASAGPLAELQGWNSPSIPNTPVIAGKYYWFAWQFQDNTIFLSYPPTGTATVPLFEYANSYGTLPASVNSANGSFSYGYNWLYYAMLCP